MRLLNLNKFLYILLFLIISLSNTQSEEPVDIWKKDINNTKSKISIETEKFVIKKNNVLKTNIKKVAILEEEAIENNDPLPFLRVSFGPAEILTSPTLNRNKGSQLKSNEEGDEENVLSTVTSKPRAPPSRSGTGNDPYKFNTGKVYAR